MDKPATVDQKDLIVELAEKRGTPIDRLGRWPNPFSKWDAANMIESLKEEKT
jgi:hypothetical protein